MRQGGSGSNPGRFFTISTQIKGDMSDNVYVSQDGLDKMKVDLAAMNKERMVIADTIESARELGDLKENAEYHSAKEAQALLHARIRELEDHIARARVVDESEMDTSKAYIGSTVRVLNKKTSKEMTYILVSPVEADMAAGKISNKSPVGQAILGKAVGETAIAKVPAGDIKLEILEITR
jgi:transcription elongation factor GreA